MEFHDLPQHWQNHIKGLHVQIRNLNDGRRISFEELQPSWRREFTRLRTDVAKFRTQRNEARSELAALRAELKARSE